MTEGSAFEFWAISDVLLHLQKLSDWRQIEMLSVHFTTDLAGTLYSAMRHPHSLARARRRTSSRSSGGRDAAVCYHLGMRTLGLVALLATTAAAAGCSTESNELVKRQAKEPTPAPAPKPVASSGPDADLSWITRGGNAPAKDWIDSTALAKGRHYQVDATIPLMPEANPRNPTVALKRMKQLPAGTAFEILVVQPRRSGAPWYHVRTKIGEGWINSVALMGKQIRVAR